MAIGIIILIIVIVGGVFASGLQIGDGGSPATLTLPGSTSAEGRTRACVAWHNARQMECNAKADEASARNCADAIRTQMLAFIASAKKATARSAWSTAVSNARMQVNMKCSPAEANACLTRTAPC